MVWQWSQKIAEIWQREVRLSRRQQEGPDALPVIVPTSVVKYELDSCSCGINRAVTKVQIAFVRAEKLSPSEPSLESVFSQHNFV